MSISTVLDSLGVPATTQRITSTKKLVAPNWSNEPLGALEFFSTDSQTVAGKIEIAGSSAVEGYSITPDMVFYTGDSNNITLSEVMRLDYKGQLGVGITPAYKLDISGDSNVTGTYRINGTSITSTVSPTGASLIGMSSVAGSTYSTLKDMQNIFHSAGWISGGSISDAGSATIDVTAGVGSLRSSNSPVAQLFNIDWSAKTGIATTADITNYVIVEWNAGTPQILTPLPTSDTSDNHTSWLLGVIVNEGGTLHIIPHKAAVGDHALKMVNRTHATDHIQKDVEVGGLILASTGTNDITVSAGALWMGLESYSTNAIDTAAASTFDSYYNNGSGFTKQGSGISAWDNANYENSGTLTALGNNKYVNLWWYLALDGNLSMLYGNAQYNNAANAEAEAAPSSVPLRIQKHGILIGRFIIKKSATTAETVQSTFTSMFNSIGVTAHGDLTDIGTNTHAQIDTHIALLTPGTGSPEGVVTATVGKLYTRTDGGASTTLYIKESGTGNTGWRAV